jgi:hypothetical protein
MLDIEESDRQPSVTASTMRAEHEDVIEVVVVEPA